MLSFSLPISRRRRRRLVGARGRWRICTASPRPGAPSLPAAFLFLLLLLLLPPPPPCCCSALAPAPGCPPASPDCSPAARAALR